MSLNSSSANIPQGGGGTSPSSLRPRTSRFGRRDSISCSLPPPVVGIFPPLAPPIHRGSSSRSREIYAAEDGADDCDVEARGESGWRNKSPRAHPSLRDRESSETTALLGDASSGSSELGQTLTTSLSKDEAARLEIVGTTPKAEFLILSGYSLPLVFACLMQYSLTGASVVTIGHLGKTQLAAVSLAIMTANVTGYCAYSGLATSLDTLCAQAYGSGKFHLVGLHVQRMVLFMLIITVPVGAVWLSATQILNLLTPDPECAALAGRYLQILLLGAPGFGVFEAGKRFLQAQGLFNATLYVLLFCAPLNAFLNWFLVWYLNWGFIGSPIAVAITNNCLPIGLVLYVYLVDGGECWGGFSKQAFKNWKPMLRLSGSGYVMLISEFLAFEILTLGSSHISTTALAAQSVLASLSFVTFQIPFPISVATSTRLANLIGAGLPEAGKVCLKVALSMAVCAGGFNIIMIATLRNYIPHIFTDEPSVVAMIVHTIPFFATFQLFDAMVAMCSGILRGMGRQKIGGWVNMICYYGFAIPVSLGTAFGLKWGLIGLWLGPAVGLFLVGTIELYFIYHTNWDKIVDDAYMRNEAE